MFRHSSRCAAYALRRTVVQQEHGFCSKDIVSRVAPKAMASFRYQVPTHRALFSTSTGNETKEPSETTTESDVNVENKGTESEATEGSSEEAVSDTELIATLEKEIHDLKEKVLRSLAEEENVRRIAKRDVENARSYANASFAKAMLEVADDLERAMTVVSEEQRQNGDATLKSLIEGIEMTDKNLQKTFKKFGVVQYGEVGQDFDPNIHDALFQMPDPTKPADTIGQVVKTGYKLHDRVIRAAQVGAYVSPPDSN